jgi:hypothetical protein
MPLHCNLQLKFSRTQHSIPFPTAQKSRTTIAVEHRQRQIIWCRLRTMHTTCKLQIKRYVYHSVFINRGISINWSEASLLPDRNLNSPTNTIDTIHIPQFENLMFTIKSTFSFCIVGWVEDWGFVLPYGALLRYM